MQRTAGGQLLSHTPWRGACIVIAAGATFAATVFGVLQLESHLAQNRLSGVQSVQGTFQPTGNGQSVYVRTGEPVQPVSPRIAVNPR